MQSDRGPGLSPAQVAHVVATAVPGFKVSAGSADELHRRITNLLDLVFNGFGAVPA